MKKVFTITLMFVSFLAVSQTLDEQFNQLKDDSETFKVYKVIKQTELNQFWSVVSDSVLQLKSVIHESNAEIGLQSTKISQQEDVIKSKDAEIESLIHDTNHISVLGIDLFKEAYIVISFSIIAILGIGLVFLFMRFRNSQTLAKQKVSEWKKLTEEFENLKKESLEKQMKLRRELQTQVNKLNEIRSA